jgi:hypothetical protein
METNKSYQFHFGDLFEENKDQNEVDEEVEMVEIDVIQSELQNVDDENATHVIEVISYTMLQLMRSA